MSINPEGNETHESPETFVLTTFAIGDDGIIRAVSEPVLLADLINELFDSWMTAPFVPVDDDVPWIGHGHEAHEHTDDCGV